MGASEQRWEKVQRVARSTLRRHVDAATSDLRDDLTQESAVLAWKWFSQLRDERRLPGAVRTIAHRLRGRELRRRRRQGWLQFVEFGVHGVAEPVDEERDPPALRVAGRRVPLPWLVDRLARVLRRLSPLDQRLLLGFHEGFCCAELAGRFGRSEDCVKTRIHRARRRVRIMFEELVEAARDLEDPVGEE